MQEMKNIVLTDKKYAQMFRAVEMNIDEDHLHRMLVPAGYDMDEFRAKRVEYFKQFGFSVQGIYSGIYAKYNDIRSDRYIPASLYYYYITPYLCNLNFMEAYVDKNMYSRLFPDVKQPETIVKSINGRFYDSAMHEMTFDDAVAQLCRHERFVIKPALETGGGSGVHVVSTAGKTVDDIRDFVRSNYSDNWISQRLVLSHPEMSRFNASSLNTMRLYTYRPVGSMQYVVLGSTLRFGGKGAEVDNACSGGGWMGIDKDGLLTKRVFRYADFTEYTQADFGFSVEKAPFYDQACRLCLDLHTRLPYFDLIGWDIAIDNNGDLVLMEFNRTPDCEHFQITHGPMFGEYLDPLMQRVKERHTDYIVVADRSFADGKQCSNHYFDFKKL